jgi:hypothetical protein
MYVQSLANFQDFMKHSNRYILIRYDANQIMILFILQGQKFTVSSHRSCLHIYCYQVKKSTSLLYTEFICK